jgi:hypothetical protein
MALREPNGVLFAQVGNELEAAAVILFPVQINNHLEKVVGSNVRNFGLGHRINFKTLHWLCSIFLEPFK